MSSDSRRQLLRRSGDHHQHYGGEFDYIAAKQVNLLETDGHKEWKPTVIVKYSSYREKGQSLAEQHGGDEELPVCCHFPLSWQNMVLPLSQGSAQSANKRSEVGVGTALHPHGGRRQVCFQPFCLVEMVGIGISAFFSAFLFVFLPNATCQRAKEMWLNSSHQGVAENG